MLTWSDLLPELLNKIAGKLDFYEDFINFLGVCSSWRYSATKDKTFVEHLPSRFPSLMLRESKTEEDEEGYRRLVLLSNGGSIRKVKLPEARQQRCISVHGWLLTTGEEEFAAKLLHPFSRNQIDLPELYMFEEYYFDQDEWMYYGHCMRKAVFTSSNPLSSSPFNSSFRVIIIWGKTIGVCRLGDSSWTRVNGWEGDLYDITYHNMQQRLYVAATGGSIYRCDVLGDQSCPLTLSRLSSLPAEELASLCFQSAYLLEWGYNSLLMVMREREYYRKSDDEFGRYGPYRTRSFQCFMFNLDDAKWLKLESLGDRAVFLGSNSSFAINASRGVKHDCIYFTDDLYEPHRDLPEGGGRDVGVYHMSDGSVKPVVDSQESLIHSGSPLWLQPSAVLPAMEA